MKRKLIQIIPATQDVWLIGANTSESYWKHKVQAWGLGEDSTVYPLCAFSTKYAMVSGEAWDGVLAEEADVGRVIKRVMEQQKDKEIIIALMKKAGITEVGYKAFDEWLCDTDFINLDIDLKDHKFDAEAIKKQWDEEHPVTTE